VAASLDVQSWCLGRGTLVSCKLAGDDPAHQRRPLFDPADAKRPYLADTGYCQRCYYARRRHRRSTGRISAVKRLYGWLAHEIDALRRFQRGRCAICPNRVGVVKQGAMDHNHAMERAGVANRYTVRGILCSTCNRYLRHIGDDPAVAIRMAMYLIDPPAPKVLTALDRLDMMDTSASEREPDKSTGPASYMNW
jgi:hypothetical protein